jgi:hypothetical protein
LDPQPGSRRSSDRSRIDQQRFQEGCTSGDHRYRDREPERQRQTLRAPRLPHQRHGADGGGEHGRRDPRRQPLVRIGGSARHPGGHESLALFFDKFAKPFRLIFYIYQIVALSLTVFALVKYLFMPLFLPTQMGTPVLLGLSMTMVVFVLLAMGCLFGACRERRAMRATGAQGRRQRSGHTPHGMP